ncbi:MAG: GT4 family glycosyltransferase PelF [Bilifractor sp.]
MRICMVCEGCYPYVVGGVSSWVHGMIRSFPDIEFIILAICTDRSISGKFAYELPENLTEVHEIYLQDADWGVNRKNKMHMLLTEREYDALRSLVLNKDVRWNDIFSLFQKDSISVDSILMGPDFLKITQEYYNREYPQIVFSDFLWTLRSIYLPLFLVLKSRVPKADLYHCVATGYAGVLGAMAQQVWHSSLLVSEHGIYTREREEELIRATWVQGLYKNIWIDQFRKMSRLAYDRAEIVTSLFAHARDLQIELGCPEEKTIVTPNGVDPARFAEIPGKLPEDEKHINVGAVLRVTEIKDVKTLLKAFAFARDRVSDLRLWIMGSYEEEPDYARECFDLARHLGLKAVTATGSTEGEPDAEVIFTGKVDVTKYLGRMDFTILTSISEGQPLTILESFAAKKPVIATDVGNCRGLIYGEADTFGEAGILTHIMHTDEIAYAIDELAEHPEKRREMGENGYHRLMSRYKLSDMRKCYEKIYRYFCEERGIAWPE